MLLIFFSHTSLYLEVALSTVSLHPLAESEKPTLFLILAFSSANRSEKSSAESGKRVCMAVFLRWGPWQRQAPGCGVRSPPQDSSLDLIFTWQGYHGHPYAERRKEVYLTSGKVRMYKIRKRKIQANKYINQQTKQL